MSNLYTIQKETLTGIADAIREKSGSGDLIYPADMAETIRGMQTGGAVFNIAYGDTAPEDTGKLWIKCAEPEALHIKNRFVAAQEALEFGVAGIPTAANGIAAAAVDGKVYLFGGDSNDGYLSAIHVFDPESNTISTLQAVLPEPAYGMAVAAVGKKIYLFGGHNGEYLKDIHVFDTQANTLSTLSAQIPTAARGIAAAAVGTKIYLFGGRIGATSSSYLTTICAFDTETETISTLSATLPKMAYDIAAATVGTKIYLFGGSYTAMTKRLDTIRVFDTASNTISTLTAVLPEAITAMAPAVMGQKVYLFGGYGGDGMLTEIRVFDTETETISTLAATLPTACYYMGVAAVGTAAYLFGGYVTASSDLSTINRFVVSLPLAENHVLIDASGVQNPCYLLPTAELGVSNVYRGNAQGIAEKVTAALYQNGAWVEI